MKDDSLVGQPANPGANAEVVWVNTEDGTFKDFAGFEGDVLFDEDVTLLVQTWADGGTPRTMNGGGAGEVIPADTPMPVRVAFLGANTLIKLATGSVAPSVWHANGRLTREELGGPATGVASYGLRPSSPGPTGATGAAGPTGPTGPTGPAGSSAQAATPIASATNISLPAGTADTFLISGSNLIETIDPNGRGLGSMITLIYYDAGFVAHDPPSVAHQLALAGGTSTGSSSGIPSTMTLRLVNRSALPGGGSNINIWMQISQVTCGTA